MKEKKYQQLVILLVDNPTKVSCCGLLQTRTWGLELMKEKEQYPLGHVENQ